MPERLPILGNLPSGTGRKSHAGSQNRSSGIIIKQAKKADRVPRARSRSEGRTIFFFFPLSISIFVPRMPRVQPDNTFIVRGGILDDVPCAVKAMGYLTDIVLLTLKL